MNVIYQASYTSKVNEEESMVTTGLKIVAWVCGLWLWASVLERTNPAIDLAVLFISAPPALLLFWSKPEYGLIALIFFGSGFLAPDIVDIRLPLLGGFEMRDILLLVLLLMSGFKGLNRKELRIAWWPVGGFLLAFLAVVMFSLFYALFLQKVPGNWAFSDARILFFYSSYFITAWTITSKKALYKLVLGCVAIADIVALIVLIQQTRGPYNYLLESMNDGSWQIWEASGATRVVPPGIAFMFLMMLVSLGLSFFWRTGMVEKILLLGNTVFLFLGLIFTYTRSAWVALIISLGLMLIVAFPVYKPYLFRSLTLIGATLLFLIGLFGFIDKHLPVNNATTAGILERFVSILTIEDTVESNSLQWRYFEIQEATKSIKNHPLTGVGLGNSYRPLTVFQGEARGQWTDEDISYRKIDRFTRYVHSSYYAIAVKMGFPGLVLLLCFIGTAILKSIKLFYSLPSSMARGVVLPIGLGMVGLLQWSFLHAHLMLASSTIVIGVLLGILASIHYIYVSHPQSQA